MGPAGRDDPPRRDTLSEVVRLFRILKSSSPQLEDFRSYWDLGRRPSPIRNARQLQRFRAVSTYTTLQKARNQAQDLGLGRWIAELEVPDDVRRLETPATGHVALEGTTPEQLLGYVLEIHSAGE